MIIGTITLLVLYFGGGGMMSFEKTFEPFLKDAVKEKALQMKLSKEGKLSLGVR